MNINRDYLIINDVKKSNIKLDNGSMFFYITDKNTQNIFVNLVINVSNNDLIQKYANIENAEDYTLTMNIVKPDNTYKVVEGKLHDKEKAIFEFDLKEDCCDEVGTYKCELLTKCNINDHEEITTSNKLTYKVKSSVLNDLDDIVEAPKYPLVIQLFDKLSDIEQYEEDRRANEVARQLAEQQRQQRFNELDTDMEDRITSINDKMADVENRVQAKEQAVDKLIVDAKVDIDDYKVAKDTEIDEYKTAKDQQIDQAITNQNNTINQAITNQNNKIDDAIANQNNKIDTAVAEQNNRIEIVEASDNTQNTRLDAIEVKNQQQDDRLLDIEKVNKRQDMDLKCLFAESKNNMIDVTEEGNSIYLQNSTTGYTLIDEIQGNTMVNCNKEPDKEIILNGNINTQGYSNVTLTEGVDGGKVDIALEGNTMVNVCDQKDPVAITKSYTVETGNHVALQGEYDGKCRPVVTGNTLVNLCIDNTFKNITTYTPGANPYCTLVYNLSAGITYTIIGIFENYSNENGTDGIRVSLNNGGSSLGSLTPASNKLVFTPNIANEYVYFYFKSVDTNASASAKFILLEGDYTNKPIPEYFEGLQSSFEDKVVPENVLGEIQNQVEGVQETYHLTKQVNINSVYTAFIDLNYDNSDGNSAWLGFFNSDDSDWAGQYVGLTNGINKVLITSTDSRSTRFRIGAFGGLQINAIYLVKGDYTNYDFSDYDPTKAGKYKVDYVISKEDGTIGQTKTFYLNSPLLEGDTIEQQGNNVFHVHKSEIRSYKTDDELTLPTDMTNTLVSKAKPQYEVISQNDTILCDSYANGHLDVDSAVPIDKVDFLHFEEELTYLYPSTSYTLQFTSDNATTVDITLGGKKLMAQSIIKGLNKITITTPETLTDNKLIIDGVGANISEVVVTNSNRDFGYFEGMKSVGECEDLEVVISNSDGTLSNTQTLTHEPLRAVGDIKDKYVLIDGKWYIERNLYKYKITGEEKIVTYDGDYGKEMIQYYITGIPNMIVSPGTINGISDKFPFTTAYKRFDHELYNRLWCSNSHIALMCLKSANLTTSDVQNLLKGTTVIYKLATPVYEPIDYNPFEVYSDITHITNNSTIPCNMIIKNTGYNCLLKPSTTYTVSSNLGLNTVTTPSTLTEDCLRFMDTDTSDVTTMKNVMVLEGDYTTGKPIPSHFAGIESAFEQEYDEEKGKYKVKIRVQNEDASKENYIEFYIDEPLRGIGDVKDKVYVKDDKVVVERNCGQRAYQDGDFGTYLTDKVNTVYPLAEPTYEEVEYGDVKLFIESFKNSTLFYNSNVPVTSKLWYSYSIPLVDTVAQTASISDEQDVMIIDLATQVAVMEMMLM